MNALAKALPYRHLHRPLCNVRSFGTWKPTSLVFHRSQRAMTSKSHYEAHTSESYESAFFYEEGAYTQYLCDLVVERLRLKDQKSGTLVDIGGGTGNFTRMLVAASDSSDLQAIVVDPFLSESSGSDGLQFFRASAEEYMKQEISNSDKAWRQGYSQVLMKEVIHHVAAADRVAIFRGMLEGARTVSSNTLKIPSILIITRPQREIDYPLWDEAREIWAKNQPHVDELIKDLLTAGFARVDYTVESYPCEIALERWQTMVKQRFWSTFATFSDSELVEACNTIEESEIGRIDANGVLRFEDRLVFIKAYI